MSETTPGRPHSAGASDQPGGGLGDGALERLGRLIENLGASLELDEVLQRIATGLEQEVPYDTFSILLLDELGHELHIRFAVGLPAEIVDNWRFGLGQGIVGTAAKLGEPVRVDDSAHDPRYIAGSEGIAAELAIPLVVRGRTIGVLDVGSREPGRFSEDHQRFLGYVAGPLANAIENARLYGNLREQARTLSLLHELSRELTAILETKVLLGRVAELIRRLIDYQLFSVMLWNEENQRLEAAFSLCYDERLAPKSGFPLGYGISGTAAALRQAIRVPNVHLDPRYVEWGHGVQVNSELVVPLVYEGRLLGVIDLESREYNAFTLQHEQMLSTLASSIAIALENARLYERVREQERRTQDDLDTARQIQAGLLPDEPPPVSGLEIGFASRPARQLGGDFYDFLPYDEHRLAIAVGDAAGKGTSGALYGALCVGILRGQVVQTPAPPAQMLAMLNDQLCQPQLANRFLALAFGVYDARTRQLELACGGFPRPWLLRGGQVEELAVEGLALGIACPASYDQLAVTLAPGDVIVLCSDGVDDMSSPADEPYGRPRLARLLADIGSRPPAEIVDAILRATNRHAGPRPEPDDDRTVVVLRARA